MKTVLRYLKNCFLLVVPVLAWNILFTEKLPGIFQNKEVWNNVPAIITMAESGFRFLFFLIILMMPMQSGTKSPYLKLGIVLYIAGLIIYFSSWLPLIYLPESKWSNSAVGFMAPSLTPVVWMMALSLIGNSFFFGITFKRWIIVIICILFLLFHNIHTLLVAKANL